MSDSPSFVEQTQHLSTASRPSSFFIVFTLGLHPFAFRHQSSPGRSRGFGFVTFADPKGAQKAVEGMNERDLDGRQVRVDIANDRPPRGEGGFSGGSRGPPRSYGGDRGYGGDDRRNGGGRSYGGGGDRYGERRSGGGGGGYGGNDRYSSRDDDRKGGRSGPYDRPSSSRGGGDRSDRSSGSRRDDY
ncbi:hypothetical protein HK097_010711 [Rhizophlyctis rosea]|uniref:RRM domain-containing protein n=1 Tax=Rhizophlyctis rosea TaxID=64517 RepID=A0AAD5SP61_9FUNG|nr:hypothetical protein HK097_010711 [Rhizophlyctis rosea]